MCVEEFVYRRQALVTFIWLMLIFGWHWPHTIRSLLHPGVKVSHPALLCAWVSDFVDHTSSFGEGHFEAGRGDQRSPDAEGVEAITPLYEEGWASGCCWGWVHGSTILLMLPVLEDASTNTCWEKQSTNSPSEQRPDFAPPNLGDVLIKCCAAIYEEQN